jgi:hypothetical protein
VRNKARLVAQGFSQVEGLDFRETFAHIACLEAIKILFAFASFKAFKLYQIDVKNTFLNGVTQEEVYVRKPSGFENPSIIIECTSFQKFCTGLSKYRGHNMLCLNFFARS